MVRIALCEAGPLTPEHDAGARADADFLAGASFLGHDVKLFEETMPDMIDEVTRFDPHVVVISRPGPFARLYPQLAPLEKPIGYLAHDLHHRRLELQAHILGDPLLRAQVMKTLESSCFLRSSLAILPTHAEVLDALDLFPGSRVTSMRYFNMAPEASVAPVGTSGDVPAVRALIFIGGSAHAPNFDGVKWFITEVLPAVQSVMPDVTLTVVGAWDEAQITGLRAPGVTFVGQLNEFDLSVEMSKAAVGISPLRFGAGMKRKTLDYLARGLPVISSRHGVEGLSHFISDHETHEHSASSEMVVPGVVIPASASSAVSASDWVASIIRLLESPHTREQLGTEGCRFVRNSFSQAQYLVDLQRVLTQLESAIDE